jgi:hypothetical protein
MLRHSALVSANQTSMSRAGPNYAPSNPTIPRLSSSRQPSALKPQRTIIRLKPNDKRRDGQDEHGADHTQTAPVTKSQALHWPVERADRRCSGSSRT